LAFVAAPVLLLFVMQVVPAALSISAHPDAAPSRAVPGFRAVGSVPDNLPVTVSIAIPLRNLGMLSSLVKQVSDPTSPAFRHFLTDGQIAQSFYPTQTYDRLMEYISTTGLTVQSTALDSSIVVQGTASKVEKAFGTGLRVYSNGTASYYISTTQSFMGAYLFASNSTALMMKPALASRGQGANVTFTEGSFSAKLLQGVYNATGLYSAGFNGSGKTIGILDFYGSPTVGSDLQAFDKQFGFADSKFTVIPIGPYDPNLGAATGWSTEISLDVEASHAMAPGASQDLYIASGASTLSDAIAKIVKDNKVNSLSQSFTNQDWVFNYLGPGYFDLNALMPDQYYMLGALKGITFSGATGDTGGTGDTSGIIGQLGYPADSPYVTAVGGTQTYFAGGSYVQTAWSDLGFVPNGVNFGGSTGGSSVLEPKPWYQSSQATPATLPAGRLNPDLSLQAGVDPATWIVDSGQTIGEGGTSESSPLFAGLVALLDSSLGTNVGLVNPFLYSIGNNQASYQKGFAPISHGYTIPWVAAPGFNLATGWGSPNIGEMYSLYKSARASPGLNVTVSLSPGKYSSGLEYIPGDSLKFNATIKNGATAITRGSFSADLVTLTGTTAIPLSYDSGAGVWTGSMTMGNQSGLSYVTVSGASGGVSGYGFATMFSGYFGLFLYPVPTDPWSTVGGLTITVESATLDGNTTLQGPLGLKIETYSITRNAYSKVLDVTLPSQNSSVVGAVNTIVLNRSIPSGPAVMVTEGSTYGYLPFVSGVYLQTTYIYPAVVAEPGSAGPGQELTIVASPVAPFNLYFLPSQETGGSFGSDLAVGTNMTARLVSPNGTVVSTASLGYQECKEALRVCQGATSLNGYLAIPGNASPGLYTVLLDANYSSETVGKTINGSFFSQIMVTGAPAQPSISVEPGFISATAPADDRQSASQALFEGEQAHVVARISYPNGTSVRYGEYTALVYPQSLQNQYTLLMHTEYANSKLVFLSYDPALQAWLGNVTIPSPSYQGSLAPLGVTSFVYSGPYEAYVTGIAADGQLTTTAKSAEQSFYVQPYVYVDGGNVSSLPQDSQLAFSGATITASGSLDGDLFLGNDVVSGGTVTISGSRITGTLEVKDANVTLVGVSGGDIAATGSTLALKDSSVGSLSLVGTKVSMTDSSYRYVTPALPTIVVDGLSETVSGASGYNVTVSGSGLSPGSLVASIDGDPADIQVSSTSSGLEASGTVNGTSLADGVHTLVLTAAQSDGLSSSVTVAFSSNSKAASLESQVSQANAAISAIQNQLSTSKTSLGTLYLLTYALAAAAIAAICVAVFALRKRQQAA
jgi:subtilase family serine protease